MFLIEGPFELHNFLDLRLLEFLLDDRNGADDELIQGILVLQFQLAQLLDFRFQLGQGVFDGLDVSQLETFHKKEIQSSKSPYYSYQYLDLLVIFASFSKVQRTFILNPTMKSLLFLISLLCCIIGLTATNPDAVLQFFEYCSYHNYPVEDHIVPTDDHYNLQFYRIQAKNTKITSGKRVIYLQHGLADSSDTWIVNEQSLAPAFHLANKGFDVWLGNSRGNHYSTHKMSPSVLDFWNFSFDQMAHYDLPAAFRYITRATQRKIHYIGHSQGTLIMFIALAEKIKGVEENLLSFNAFGPIAYIKHQSSKLLNQLSRTSLLSVLIKSHVKEIFIEGEGAMRYTGALCKIDPYPCLAGLRLISQMNNTVNNVRRLPVIMAHFPSGSSTKNFQHFQQFVRNEVFNRFDYGKHNQAVYGQKTPPVYNLSKISTTVHLHVGVYDKLADVKDSTRLFNELTNSPNKTMKTYQFGHATFIWGKTLEHVENALAFINQADDQAHSNIFEQ